MSRVVFFLLVLALVPGPASAQDSTPVSTADEWGPRLYVRADAGILSRSDQPCDAGDRTLIQPFVGWRMVRWAAVEIGLVLGGEPRPNNCSQPDTDLAYTTTPITPLSDAFVGPGVRLALTPSRVILPDPDAPRIFAAEGNSGLRFTAGFHYLALDNTPVASLGGSASLGLERVGLGGSAFSVGIERWWLYPPDGDGKRRRENRMAAFLGLQVGLSGPWAEWQP